MPKTPCQPARRVRAVLLALALAVLAALPASSAPALAAPAKTQTRAPARPPAFAEEAPADAPVRRFQTLLTRKNFSTADLRRLEDQLEQAKATRPDGLPGAKATFFLARVREEIARKSGLKADWFKAAEGFGEYIERFPKNMLAPDARLRRGTIRLTHLANAEGAAQDFQAILREHPRSAQAFRARELARVAARAQAPPQPQAGPKRPEPAADPPKAAPERATLMDIRPKNNGGTARVVLDLDDSVRFKYQLLEPASAKDAHNRVYIDLLRARLGPGTPEDLRPAGGILRSVRAVQRDPDTVRVVFDFSELKDYKVQTLDNPFRVVIDATAGPPMKDLPKETPREPARPQGEPTGISQPTGERKRLAADLVEQLGLTVQTVIVDAGHGAKDHGAQAFGLSEKDINLRMALILGAELKKRGLNVLHTRTTDVFLTLEERTAQANAKKADLFLSVHCNAHADPGMNGLETYSLNLAKTPDAVRVAARENSVSDKNISDLQMILTDLMLTSKIKESFDLAHAVHRKTLDGVRRGWTLADHGNREAPFYVLMGAKMPSVLIELGYLTNKTEAARLNNDPYLRTLARGIADGVMAYKAQIERFNRKK